MRAFAFAAMLAVLGVSSSGAQEQAPREPAVSDFNLYGGPSLGRNQDTVFGSADVNMALPLGERFGLQIGGTPNIINSRLVGQAEVHLFTRDPAVGMIGLYGSYTGWNGWGGSDIPAIYTDVFDSHAAKFRVGIEGEYFNGPWTVSAVGGWKNSGETPFFLDSRLTYYPDDTSKIYVGYEFTDRWLADQSYYLLDTKGAVVDSGKFKSPDLNIGKIGFEKILPFNVTSSLNGTSIYAEAQIGDGGYYSGMIGLRFRFNDLSRAASIGQHIEYNGDTNFGGDTGESLQSRDRTDYVLNWLPKDPRKGKYKKTPTVVKAACTPDGQTCSLNDPTSCCSGACQPNGGNPICGAAPPACTPDGQTCSVNDPSTCCSGACQQNGGNPICGTAPPACTPGGGSCDLNNPASCCSGACAVNGGNPICESVCTPSGGSCDLNSPGSCCSGTCAINGGNPICESLCTPSGGSCDLNNPASCCSGACAVNGGNPICAAL